MMLTLAIDHVTENTLKLVYLVAAVLFIVGLKMLAKVPTAKRGNLISALGMLIATVATFFYLTDATAISLVWVAVALLLGSGIGVVMATKVQMTGMPQMVGLLNGFGGIASLLVAIADYSNFYVLDAYERAIKLGNFVGTRESFELLRVNTPFQEAFQALSEPTWDTLFATGLAVLIGGVTFTGSLMAFGKLQGTNWAPDKPVQFPGQKIAIVAMLLGSLILSGLLIAYPEAWWTILVITLAALVLGIFLVIGIGGADMPVVIALLNSYSGIAASMAGFVLGNAALIITGSLVGASGLILTNIMCKAMNRSLLNVLFGGVGGAVTGGKQITGEARSFSVEDAAIVFDAAQNVVIVPGYGMAVAQAQHAVKELSEELQGRGINVRFAIHPVAGRMPGHMNVLLAEAGVPYEQLLDLDQINPEFEQTDVALVIGANDVVNPAARHDQGSPIFGMPILDVDKSRMVFVIKRSMNPGFAGIQNELFFNENTGMIFGDAKKIVTELTAELEGN